MCEKTDVATFPRAKGTIVNRYCFVESRGAASMFNNETAGLITHTVTTRCAIDTVWG